MPKARVQVERYDVEGHEDDADDEGTWAIEGTIDLRRDTNPEGPLVTLIAIGE